MNLEIRDAINIMRKLKLENKNLLFEQEMETQSGEQGSNLDETSLESLSEMFRETVGPTSELDSASVSSGVLTVNGIVGGDLRFNIVISKDSNLNSCVIILQDNSLELNERFMDGLNKLHNFYLNDLYNYAVENYLQDSPNEQEPNQEQDG